MRQKLTPLHQAVGALPRSYAAVQSMAYVPQTPPRKSRAASACSGVWFVVANLDPGERGAVFRKSPAWEDRCPWYDDQWMAPNGSEWVAMHETEDWVQVATGRWLPRQQLKPAAAPPLSPVGSAPDSPDAPDQDQEEEKEEEHGALFDSHAGHEWRPAELQQQMDVLGAMLGQDPGASEHIHERHSLISRLIKTAIIPVTGEAEPNTVSLPPPSLLCRSLSLYWGLSELLTAALCCGTGGSRSQDCAAAARERRADLPHLR